MISIENLVKKYYGFELNISMEIPSGKVSPKGRKCSKDHPC